MFGGRTIGYPRDVDPDVQDPAGESADNAEAEELTGLRALFRKPAVSSDAAEPARAGVSARGNGARGNGVPADRAGPAAARNPGLTKNAADSALTKNAPDSALTKNGPDPGLGKSGPAPGTVRNGADRTALVSGPGPAKTSSGHATRRPAAAYAVISRPLMNPRLRADPRIRVWLIRVLLACVVFAGFTIWLSWRIGVTAGIIYAIADVIYKSKTTSIVPASVRVTSAQRLTSRRLKVLHPAGYLALNARSLPGTTSVIDHVVVGPAGIFTLDSERMDKRLPVRAIGGMLYYGKQSLEGRLDHAVEEANQAAALIGKEVGRRVKVRPGMVIYGPALPWVIMRLKGVDIFDGGRVGTYFRRQSKATRQSHLDGDQIAAYYAAAARALPPRR
jgi:hypothetical protein